MWETFESAKVSYFPVSRTDQSVSCKDSVGICSSTGMKRGYKAEVSLRDYFLSLRVLRSRVSADMAVVRGV